MFDIIIIVIIYFNIQFTDVAGRAVASPSLAAAIDRGMNSPKVIASLHDSSTSTSTTTTHPHILSYCRTHTLNPL